jgi:hypothetical protein
VSVLAAKLVVKLTGVLSGPNRYLLPTACSITVVRHILNMDTVPRLNVAPEIGVVYLWLNPINHRPDLMAVGWELFNSFLDTLRKGK